MKKINNVIIGVVVVAFVTVVFTQCASQQNTTASSDTQKGAPEYVLQKSGAQLWAESCIRCHNTASPATFSDVQWDVAMRHMQLRAQLTEVEANKILEFIQSAN